MVAKMPELTPAICLFGNGKWAPTKIEVQERRLPDRIEIRQPDGSSVRLLYWMKIKTAGMEHAVAIYVHDTIPLGELWDEPESTEPRIWTPGG